MYALELLTVYAWEQGCRTEDFDIVEGIRTVLGLILQQEQLCVYWVINYNFENVTIRNILLSQLRSSRYELAMLPSLPVHLQARLPSRRIRFSLSLPAKDVPKECQRQWVGGEGRTA